MSLRKKNNDKQIKYLHEGGLCRNGEIELQIDRQEQYSRKNCLLIHDIEERSQEVTDKLVAQTIKSEMDIDIDERILIELIEQLPEQKTNVKS